MRTIRLAVLLVALTGSLSLGQEQPADNVQKIRYEVSPSKRFDLQLESVPLSDLVTYLADTTSENIVLLAPPNVDASQIRVPPLKLKRVSLEQVLDLVTSIPDLHVEYDVSGDESRVISVRVFNVPQAVPAMVPGAAEMGGMMPPIGVPDAAALGSPSDQPVLTVLPLERLLLGANPAERVPEDAKRQELLEARTKQSLTLIDQAFAMDPHGQAKPEIKLHPETHTLLVKANPTQLQVVTQVLSALEVSGPSNAQRDYEQKLNELMQNAQMQQKRMEQELTSRLRLLEEQLVRAQKQREELEARASELEGQLRAETARRLMRVDEKPAQPQ